MDRAKSILTIADTSIVWDIIIVGGGVTGIGAAVDAASRGYKTLLVEQSDFGKGTSSRSTKLIHGGVRYLQQGNLALVLESLKERGILMRNAPHLVKDLEFIVPYYRWWQGPYFGLGLKLYDLLAGKLGLGASQFLSKAETIEKIPTIEAKGLHGGILYHDGQFDDSRLLINLAQTADACGATLANYTKVVALLKDNDRIKGVALEDQETGKTYNVNTKIVVNATGVFTDALRQMDDASALPIMTSSQGVHIVLDNHFLPGKSAMMLPGTDDGRLFFIIPWQDKIIVGTTDTPVKKYTLEPIALDEEIEFLLSHSVRYLTKKPARKDIKSVFTGLRPLVTEKDSQNTAKISREHAIDISPSGLLSIAGGKWTTYRKMAEDTIDKAILIAGLDFKSSTTQNLTIYGYHKNAEVFGHFSHYGSEATNIDKLLDEKPNYKNKLHPDYFYVEGEVIWAIRQEMTRGIEDFIARRTRLLFLDVQAALCIAPRVAHLMAQELGFDKQWEDNQLLRFIELSKKYFI